jgi:DNA-directed RNA polymerase subunit RPC12/RpoP
MDWTTGLLIAGAVIVLAAVGYLIFRWMSGQRKDESVYHFRCTGCGRRLRYNARQVGRKGRCSHCSADVTFPAVSGSID